MQVSPPGHSFRPEYAIDANTVVTCDSDGPYWPIAHTVAREPINELGDLFCRDVGSTDGTLGAGVWAIAKPLAPIATNVIVNFFIGMDPDLFS